MAVIAWSALYDEVLPFVPGCPTALADAAIRRTVIAFCDRAKVWTKVLAPIASAANTMTYTLTSGVANAEICGIKKVSFNDIEVKRRSPSQLDAYYKRQDWRLLTATMPLFFTEEMPNKLMLVPAPDSVIANAIDVIANLRPTVSAAGIDDTEFDFRGEYQRPISDGVLAYLKKQPRKPWSDPQWKSYEEAFDASIGAYSLLNSKGRGRNEGYHVTTHYN